VSRVSRAEVALGAPPVVEDDPVVVEPPKPAPAKSKASAKPTESEEPSA
jgi:hypothetical protein